MSNLRSFIYPQKKIADVEMKNKEKGTATAQLKTCFSCSIVWVLFPSVFYFLFIFLREKESKENTLLKRSLRLKENNKIK